MKLKYFFMLIFVFYGFLNATTHCENDVFIYQIKDNPYYKNGLYNKAKVDFKNTNDNFSVSLVYQKLNPKKNAKTVQEISVREMKTDSVYYHNIWIDDDFYETFVYDTTFVDTSYTILNTIKIHPETISQTELMLDWTHRQQLWYYWGIGAKFTYINNGQNAIAPMFHQTFYKKINNLTFSYQSAFISTFFKSKKIVGKSVTIYDDKVYDTTSDSLYLHNPDSVFTYVHTEETFDYPVTEWENKNIFQISNKFSTSYKKFNLSFIFNFVKDKKEVRGYYKSELSYISYLYSLHLKFYTGNSYLMHLDENGYFNLGNEKVLYGYSVVSNFYTLNKRWFVSLEFGYSKMEKMKIRGALLSVGVNF